MYEQLIIKIIIPDALTEGVYTLYLFSKTSLTLLPVTVEKSACEALLSTKANQNLRLASRPEIHDTLKRTILGLGGKLVSVLIYKIHESDYYTYLNFKTGKKTIQVACGFADAVILATAFSVPILIERDLLEKEGIKITKELIEKSLAEL